MKHTSKVFLCLFFILSSLSAFSQHSVGVIGGQNIPFVNFTDFVIDARYRSEVLLTNQFGISYRYQDHKNIGVQVDLIYSEKGWGQVLGDSSQNSVKNIISYIELPAYLRWTLLGKRKFNIAINAGCYAAYAIDAKTTFENDQKLEEVVAEYDINTDNRGDFGVLIGLGVSYKFPIGTFQVEGGARIGMGNILATNPITRENPAISTNIAPHLSFSYHFPLKRPTKE